MSTLSMAFSTFSDWFLRITLSDSFLNIPYTSRGLTDLNVVSSEVGNRFVYYGWGIVRDFINMFFILILIIIGLSTSLQIQTYKWQKTLPRLIAVALLVNFTPLVLGMVIDFSNMMMNYFVASVASESLFIIRMIPLYDLLISELATTQWASFTGQVLDPIGMAFIFIFFNLFSGIIYLLYASIFALRYVAIWLLVIISPFAFFCYILPATQPFFRAWWRWFIGWCIIGIAGVFFLYLGEIMFQDGFINPENIMPDIATYHGMNISVFIQVFPLLIPLFFLLFGLFISFSMASLGSRGILETFQKASIVAKKSSAQLPGSNFREKTMAASAAVRGAFSPGPAAMSSSSSTSGISGKSSYRSATKSGSLHRRDISINTSTTTGAGILNARTPITQVTSIANRGSESATKSIAADFSQSIPESSLKKTSSAYKNVSSVNKNISESSSKKTSSNYSSDQGDASSGDFKKPEKKCVTCGAALSSGSTLCPLCRKNSLPDR